MVSGNSYNYKLLFVGYRTQSDKTLFIRWPQWVSVWGSWVSLRLDSGKEWINYIMSWSFLVQLFVQLLVNTIWILPHSYPMLPYAYAYPISYFFHWMIYVFALWIHYSFTFCYAMHFVMQLVPLSSKVYLPNPEYVDVGLCLMFVNRQRCQVVPGASFIVVCLRTQSSRTLINKPRRAPEAKVQRQCKTFSEWSICLYHCYWPNLGFGQLCNPVVLFPHLTLPWFSPGRCPIALRLLPVQPRPEDAPPADGAALQECHGCSQVSGSRPKGGACHFPRWSLKHGGKKT